MNHLIISSLFAQASVAGRDGSHYTIRAESDGDLMERYYLKGREVSQEDTIVASECSTKTAVTYLYDSVYQEPYQRLVYYISEDDGLSVARLDKDTNDWNSTPVDLPISLHESSKLSAVYTVDDDCNNLFFQDEDGNIRLARQEASDEDAPWEVVEESVVPYTPDEGAPISVSVADIDMNSSFFYIRSVRNGVIVEGKYGPTVKSTAKSISPEPIQDMRQLLAFPGPDGATVAFVVHTLEDQVWKIEKKDSGSWELEDLGTIDEDGNYRPASDEQAFTPVIGKLVSGVKGSVRDLKAAKADKKVKAGAKK